LGVPGVGETGADAELWMVTPAKKLAGAERWAARLDFDARLAGGDVEYLAVVAHLPYENAEPLVTRELARWSETDHADYVVGWSARGTVTIPYGAALREVPILSDLGEFDE
jgi:hypothetical protein